MLPFFFCKVICPLGAVFSLTRKLSPVAPTIRSADCIACGKCDQVCPQQIEVQKEVRVASMECTQCLECIDACPKNCIELQVGYAKKLPSSEGKTSWWKRGGLIPVLVAVMMAVGFGMAFNVKLPTLKKTFPLYETKSGFSQVDMIVNGLRCRGKSSTLGYILGQDPGIAYLETYVSEFRARILYDPAQTNPDKIRKEIEAGRKYIRKGDGKSFLLKFQVEKVLP